MSAGWTAVLGTDAEEQTRGTISYLDVLTRLHLELSPTHYLEIGVRLGRSLSLARGPATGIDPAPGIDCEFPPTTKIFPITSDEYFAFSPADIEPDFAFIDGKHLAEYALRDFMNTELRSKAGAVVVVDNIFPNHPAQAERIRRTRAWTGDVWRLVGVLRDYRPDLFLLLLDTSPAGLLLIAGIDPQNRTLWDSYDTIVREVREYREPTEDIINRRNSIDPTGKYFDDVVAILKNARASSRGPAKRVARLRLLSNPQAKTLSIPSPKPKLSVVVIGYNMARELPRTLRSLSPSMQRGITAEDYEVIVVDNGSSEEPDETELLRFLPNLVVHKMIAASVSPAAAINVGLRMTRGDLVGVWIDGARLASPGLLAAALTASRLHEYPMIGTIAFHLGPSLQRESIKRGYRQAVEDDLLAKIDWEKNAYRLFEISTLAGSSAGGWFELPAECSAVFLRAHHWRELGGYDERFITPGGGLVNLDTWSRICNEEKGALIMLLGEATFHQIHGGIVTNNLQPPHDLFHEEYVKIRGVPYAQPTRRPLYFGTIPDAMKPMIAAAKLT